MNIREKISELNIPNDSFVVVGSGILGALGIRESDDIDLVVTKQEFIKIENLGWKKSAWGDHMVLQEDVFDIGDDWYGESTEDLLEHAQVVDGIPYLSLDAVYEWKKQLGREKDLRDIVLIDTYRQKN